MTFCREDPAAVLVVSREDVDIVLRATDLTELADEFSFSPVWPFLALLAILRFNTLARSEWTLRLSLSPSALVMLDLYPGLAVETLDGCAGGGLSRSSTGTSISAN